MSTINFIPPSYYRQQHRRVRCMIEIVVVVAVAALFVVAHLAGESGIVALRKKADETRAQGAAVQRQLKELASLQAEHRELSNQLKVHRQVMLPISFTHVLSAISNLAPQSIAMTDLRLETTPPVPTAATVASTKAKSKPAKTVPAAKKTEPLKIEVTGLSPDDGRIADFVGALAESPLFSDVKLLFSRSSEQDGIVSRRFRVTMEVRLDQVYVDQNSRQAQQGVVNAD